MTGDVADDHVKFICGGGPCFILYFHPHRLPFHLTRRKLIGERDGFADGGGGEFDANVGLGDAKGEIV